MNITEIGILNNANIAKTNVYGRKIGILSELAGKGLNVPIGFYFSIESTNNYSINNAKNKITSFFMEFKKNNSFTDDDSFIVRSSMSVEDNIAHQFPGMFLSIKDVKENEALNNAIEKCIESKDSEKVLRYINSLKKNISIEDIKISILVQIQKEILYFGLAEIKHNNFNYQDDFLTLEITKKNSFSLVKGEIIPSAIRLYKDSHFEILSNTENIDFEELKLWQLNAELTKVSNCLNFDSIIEFGIDKNSNVYIFQAREHEIKGKNPLRGYVVPKEKTKLSELKKTIILPNEKRWGLKGAAMEYFKANNLFNEPLLLIDNENTLTKIKKLLNENKFCNESITLRFSKGDEIGLKRFFTHDKTSAFIAIAKYFTEFQNLQQLLIIHPFLDGFHSYELLIDNDYFVVEHIPGLWEANNTLEPDVIHHDTKQNITEILKVKERRQMIISTPFSTDREFVEPLEFDFLIKRLEKFKTFYKQLKNDFVKHLPLNFHFIENKNEEIAFLNIRRLSIKRNLFKDKRYVRDGSFFYVSNEKDLQGWDGTPILLRVSTERGKEKDLIRLASKLPKDVDIYINFGWLSHPAMILREFGIHIIPAYLKRDIKIIKD